MTNLNIALIVLVICMCATSTTYAAPGSRVVSSFGNDDVCMCGKYLGLHCGLRAQDNDCVPAGDATLYGKGCKKQGFYQCSEIDEPAVLKGYCPHCTVVAPGVDQCLSPTFIGDAMSGVQQRGKCYCGDWLGLHCGLRTIEDHCKPEEVTLYGDCRQNGFYQCSARKQEATFKGFCPNCRVVEPGLDQCLSPTFEQIL